MKNYPTIILMTLLILLMSVPSFAQINKGGTPISSRQDLKGNLDFVKQPTFDVDQMIEEDLENEIHGMTPYRFAHVFDVNYSLENSGVWDELSNGDKVWRFGVTSKNAYSLNISFSEFFIPPDASVFVYNEDKSVILGAFSDEFNQRDDLVAISPVPGDKLIVEYYLPAKSEFKGRLEIGRIGHDYRDLFGTTDYLKSSGACNVDINCTAGNGWQTAKRSVCRILINNSGLCTGTLINNTSQNNTPYLLTANHCYPTSSTGSSTNSVFLFNYEKPNCGSGTASTTQTVSGATIRAKSSASDFCLLELNSTPPTTYGAYLAGWNRSTNAPSGSTTGIHHPDGDVKKISVENQTLTSTSYLSNTSNSNGTHWRVANWDVGVTEGGSSGSALFDANQRIIGQLHGGYAACNGTSDNGQPDWYGKFSKSWDTYSSASQQLKAWLDPNNSGATSLSGQTLGSASGCTTDAYEINNSFSTRKYIGSSSSISITNLCITSNDNDYFYFYANGQYYTIRVRGYSSNTTGQYRLSVIRTGTSIIVETHPLGGSTTDTYLHLYNNSQSQLATDDDSGTGLFSKITYTIPGCSGDSYETNDLYSQRKYIGSSSSISINNLCLTSNDNDYFYFYAGGGQWFSLRVRGFSSSSIGQYRLSVTRSSTHVTVETHPINGSTTDTYLHLYINVGQSELATNDDGGFGAFSKIVYPLNTFKTDFDEQMNMGLVDGDIDIYPNPTFDSFTITFNEYQEASDGAIFNIAGKQVKTFAINNELNKNVDVSDLPSGIFMVKIQTKDGFIIKKLIVK